MQRLPKNTLFQAPLILTLSFGCSLGCNNASPKETTTPALAQYVDSDRSDKCPLGGILTLTGQDDGRAANGEQSGVAGDGKLTDGEIDRQEERCLTPTEAMERAEAKLKKIKADHQALQERINQVGAPRQSPNENAKK